MGRYNPLRWLLIGLVRLYQLLISPLLGPVCRYYPSCSHYAIGALQTHGALRGSWLATRRLLRCHPWSPGGVDHVPPARSARPRSAQPASAQPASARSERASIEQGV